MTTARPTTHGGTRRRIQAQRRILASLRENGPQTVEELTVVAHRSYVGTWLLLQGLTRQGLVERYGHAGGRGRRPYLYGRLT